MERMRRLRRSEMLRNMVRENHVRVDELIYPVFVTAGENLCNPVASMPGICQYSIDRLKEELDRVVEAGVPSVLLFGIPEHTQFPIKENLCHFPDLHLNVYPENISRSRTHHHQCRHQMFLHRLP